MIRLPLRPSVPRYTFTTSIEGAPYAFAVYWNARDLAWYFDLFETDQTPIVRGVKVVLGTALARTTKHLIFRTGALIAIDTSGAGRDAGIDDLGGRVEVRYLRVYDIMALINGRRKV